MNILVINCGSSSAKVELIDTEDARRLIVMRVERMNEVPEIRFAGEEDVHKVSESGHEATLNVAFSLLLDRIGDMAVDGIGHRVVHGGSEFSSARRITAEVKAAIDELRSLAPLHNPVNLVGIEMAEKHFPNLPHVAVFDTAFHATLPRRAQHYAISNELAEKHGIRRYGFHGTSHQYVAHKAAEYLDYPLAELRIITCHLGNGCSMAAVEYGRSIETSMGMTPLEGLVMGTRVGDIDPGVLVHLMREEGWGVDELDRMLNKESGLKGLSGIGNDMRDIEEKAAEGDENCRLAIHVFAHRIRKYIGAYAAIMGGVDAIVFTAGIGENSVYIRERVAQRLDFLGAVLDEDENRDARLSTQAPVADISTRNSRCKILAIRTDEQYAIAKQAADIVAELHKVNKKLSIPIAVSARHVHLTEEIVEALFGPGAKLTKYRDLSQPGQFAANERVTLIGPKNKIERVRILGPCRSKNQVEISRTDEFFLGIDAPVRQSGHIENTPGITLEGSHGRVTLKNGLICAWRHIHMTPEDAENFGVEDKDIVEVRVQNDERSLTFGNVLIRVSPKYALEMHIDTDEANAAEIGRSAEGVLVGVDGSANLIRRGHLGL